MAARCSPRFLSMLLAPALALGLSSARPGTAAAQDTTDRKGSGGTGSQPGTGNDGAGSTPSTAGQPSAAGDSSDGGTTTATPTAADRQRAEDLIREGVALRREGQDAEALEKFEGAYALNPTPRGRAQIALAEAALGRWVVAEAHLVEALAADGDPWITRARPTLEDSLGTVRQRLGSIEVLGGVPEAEILIDGRVVGTLPLEEPIRVVAGTVSLVVTHPKYYPVERRVVVPRARLTRETIQLNPRPEPAPGAGAAVGAGAGAAAGAAGAAAAGGAGGGAAASPGAAAAPSGQVSTGATPVESGGSPSPASASTTGSSSEPGAAAASAERREEPGRRDEDGDEPKETGFVLSLLGAAGGFLGDLPGTGGVPQVDGDLSPGFGGALQIGGRVSPFFSFGLIGSFVLVDASDLVSSQDVDNAWTVVPAIYMRLHSGRGFAGGLLDLWAGLGVGPYSRIQIDFTGGSTIESAHWVAVTLPIQFGLTVFVADEVGLDLGTHITGWFPGEFCVEASGSETCENEGLDNVWSWQTTFGLTFLL